MARGVAFPALRCGAASPWARPAPTQSAAVAGGKDATPIRDGGDPLPPARRGRARQAGRSPFTVTRLPYRVCGQ